MNESQLGQQSHFARQAEVELIAAIAPFFSDKPTVQGDTAEERPLTPSQELANKAFRMGIRLDTAEGATPRTDQGFLGFPDDGPLVISHKQRVWQLSRRIERELNIMSEESQRNREAAQMWAYKEHALRAENKKLRGALAAAQTEAAQFRQHWKDAVAANEPLQGELASVTQERDRWERRAVENETEAEDERKCAAVWFEKHKAIEAQLTALQARATLVSDGWVEGEK